MTTLADRCLRFTSAALLAACATGCLPADTRKTPGSILTTIESDGVAASGIDSTSTVDGWSIAFDQVLVNLGQVTLDGDGCDAYSDGGYFRVFDMKTAGQQKVSIIYALGHCAYGYRISSPGADAVLGEGTTESDRTMMREPGSDLYNDRAGISMYLKGHATLGETTKTFEWPFRLRVRYTECADGLDFSSGRAERVALGVHPSVLFADRLDPDTAHLRFQIFADADTLKGDNDGTVTLSELSRISYRDAGFAERPSDGGEPADAAVRISNDIDASFAHDLQVVTDDGPLTLEDYVYLVLFPAMVRYPGESPCRLRLTSRGLGL